MKKIIVTAEAPAAIGAYSQAVMSGDLLFTSGQLPIVPATGVLLKGDIGLQAKQAMDNIGAILKEAGMDFSNVIKTVVLLRDIGDFAAVNEVYAGYFTENFPARSCFQAGALPKGADIEIEAVAAK